MACTPPCCARSSTPPRYSFPLISTTLPGVGGRYRVVFPASLPFRVSRAFGALLMVPTFQAAMGSAAPGAAGEAAGARAASGSGAGAGVAGTRTVTCVPLETSTRIFNASAWVAAPSRSGRLRGSSLTGARGTRGEGMMAAV